jgi:hypothetical protein
MRVQIDTIQKENESKQSTKIKYRPYEKKIHG